VVRTRDVIFDEDSIFPGSIEQLKDELRDIKLDELQQLLNRIDMLTQRLPMEEEADQADREDNSPTFMLTHQPDEEIHIMTETEAVDTASRALQLGEEMERLELAAYPIPQPIPPASCLAGAITQSQVESQPQLSQSQPWNAAFAAGLLAGKLNIRLTRASAICQIRKPNQAREQTKSGPFLSRDQVIKHIQSGGLVKLHRRELPPELKSH
jgi:hypothetical protein